MRIKLFSSYLLILVLAATIPGSGSTFCQQISSSDTATLVIKDPARYSKTFLAKLRTFDYSSHYELNDSLLIIGRLDTAYFPTDLPERKTHVFSGTRNNTRFELTVRRLNFTTLAFSLKLYRSGKLSADHKGLAELEPGFFLGAETDEEDSGNAYLSTEYYSRTGNCDLSIRIGVNDRSQLCAKVIASCKDSSNDISLSECPTLYAKQR